MIEGTAIEAVPLFVLVAGLDSNVANESLLNKLQAVTIL